LHTFRKFELLYWTGQQNFGDVLSDVIVAKILSDRGHSIREGIHKPTRLMAIGSMIDLAQDDAVVWGTGRLDIKKSKSYRNLDIRAVRGNLTKIHLERMNFTVPNVTGDPGLLVPQLFPGLFKKNPIYPYVIIPHWVDYPKVNRSYAGHVISPLLPWNHVISEMLKGERVISSSLHGIILAQAFDVPVTFVLSSSQPIYKYEDYFQGVGQVNIKDYMSVNFKEGITNTSKILPKLKYDTKPLLDAFPIDIWEKCD